MLCKRVGERNNLFVGNNTESEVDMKKAKNITVIYCRIKGKPRRNKSQYRIIKSARLKIKLYLNKKMWDVSIPIYSFLAQEC